MGNGTHLRALRLRDLFLNSNLRLQRTPHARLPRSDEGALGHFEDLHLPRHLPRAEIRGENPPRLGRSRAEGRRERLGRGREQRPVDLVCMSDEAELELDARHTHLA